MSKITPRGFDFVMYLVKDLKQSRAFYEGLFDLTPGDFNSEGFIEYTLPDGNAFALAVAPGDAHVQCGGVMFGVPDAEAAIARVKELGGTFYANYGGDICTSGWCADPDGNGFGVHERK